MISVLLITHQNLARNYVNIIDSIFPEHNINFQTLEIPLDFDSSKQQEFYLKSLKTIELFNNKNFIIISDLYGSSPFNLANELAKFYKAPLLSGLSLPMLIKLANLNQNNNAEMNIYKIIYSIQQSAMEAMTFTDYTTYSESKINNTKLENV